MTAVEVVILVVTEDRAVINVNTLHIFQTAHLLEWHVELFGLRKEIWAGREHKLWMWRCQWRSLPLLSRMRSSWILHVVGHSDTWGRSWRN
jgi:hypothetical protein